MSWNDILFSPYGRIRRRDFWIWSIVKTIAIPLLFVAVMLLTTLLHIKDKDMQGLIGIADFYLCLALFALANICLIVKRWHDRDKSGWMYLILIIPFIGWLWTLIECGFLDGTQGRNRYGRSPKGLGEEPRAF